MLDGKPTELSVALDIADKAIKLIAVMLGGIWTYWNYKKSRTYEQKMELQLAGTIFERNGTYIEVLAKLKNLGETVHPVQQEGTYCEIIAIYSDMSEQSVRLSPIFTRDQYIEPGETISDRVLTLLRTDVTDIVWLRVDLRVASGRVEWQETDVIRLTSAKPDSGNRFNGEA